MAVELVDERLAKGAASDYQFVFAERDGEVVGYACYGPIACTVSSYDLYWVAVDPRVQRQGLGRRLVSEMETLVRQAGGSRVYLDTSSRDQYASTRAFYAAGGYQCAARLVDFYAPVTTRWSTSKCSRPPTDRAEQARTATAESARRRRQAGPIGLRRCRRRSPRRERSTAGRSAA